MVVEAIGNIGLAPREVSADAGYYSGEGGRGTLRPGCRPVHRTGPDPPRQGFAAGAPRTHTQAPVRQGPGCAGSCGRNGAGSVTPCGWRRWSRYSAGSSRDGGFRQFLLRSLEKVNREWQLICTGHNLLKLFRFRVSPPGKARGNGPTGNIKEISRTVSSSISERLSGRLRPPPAGMVVVN